MLDAIAVLAAANVLNNRVAPRLAPLTSAAATGALVAIGRRRGLSWERMGFAKVRPGVRAGSALAAAVAAGYAAALAHPRLRPLLLDDRALRLSRARLAEEILLQVPIGTVLLEEAGFRGVLYGLAERAHGRAAATALTSALFGLWHILPAIDMARANPAVAALAIPESTGPAVTENFTSDTPECEILTTIAAVAGTVAVTAGAGVFFCALRERYGLLAPVMTHTATNGLGFLAARIARRLSRNGTLMPRAQ